MEEGGCGEERKRGIRMEVSEKKNYIEILNQPLLPLLKMLHKPRVPCPKLDKSNPKLVPIQNKKLDRMGFIQKKEIEFLEEWGGTNLHHLSFHSCKKRRGAETIKKRRGTNFSTPSSYLLTKEERNQSFWSLDSCPYWI